MTGARWRRDADVVVVGSGAAGICAALTAAGTGASVLVITKELAGGASPLAQGGLAAAIGPGDTASAHARDTQIAGVGLCEPDVVAALAAGSPEAVNWLVSRGARLERRALRLEGGHGAHRIVHSGDDATGAEVHRTLLEALLSSGIEVLDRTVALDLLPCGSPAPGGSPASGGFPPRGLDVTCSAIEGGRRDIERAGKGGNGTSSSVDGVRGVAVAAIGSGGVLSPGVITARAVILAAGGLGQAYATTSNPPGATGDALAMALRAGAVLRDPEFVQFHPTVLYLPGAAPSGMVNQNPLITEALRGAGAVLRDLDGRPVMAGHDPRGDLAPRDVVAARVHSVIAAASGDGAYGSGHVWLDATALGADVLENGFPTVTAACRKRDIDPVTDLIPVAPGAHYSCGGIRADLDGRTSLPGLYAVGEAASTGVHGANRLASNSLVEAIIAGRRAGIAASREISGSTEAADTAQDGARCHTGSLPNALDVTSAPLYGAERHIEPLRGDAGARGAGAPEAAPRGAGARGALAGAMSRYAGVLRDASGLERLLRIIESRPSGWTRQPPPSQTGWMRHQPPKSEVDAAAIPSGGASGGGVPLTLAEVEAANLREVSGLIAAAALRRVESRGAHRRSDAPETAPAPRHTLARRASSRREYHAPHDHDAADNRDPAHSRGTGIDLDWEEM